MLSPEELAARVAEVVAEAADDTTAAVALERYARTFVDRLRSHDRTWPGLATPTEDVEALCALEADLPWPSARPVPALQELPSSAQRLPGSPELVAVSPVIWNHGDALYGFLVFHRRADAWCGRGIAVVQDGERPRWHMTDGDPDDLERLTLEPSITCGCGWDGWIRSGTWIPMDPEEASAAARRPEIHRDLTQRAAPDVRVASAPADSYVR